MALASYIAASNNPKIYSYGMSLLLTYPLLESALNNPYTSIYMLLILLTCLLSKISILQSGNKLGANSPTRGRNLALNGTQGEVGVSMQFFFFLGRLIYILTPHNRKLW